jgi:hypothetical protein
MRKLFFIAFLLMAQLSIATELEEDMSLTGEGEEEITQNSEHNEEDFIHEKKYATVQVLNKITAKLKYLEIPVNSEVMFSSLRIKVLRCWKASLYDLSENKILLNIVEKKTGQQEYVTIFNGWMFSSSPAISSMEHPVYDVVAIDCHD